jgi:transcription-repair coupling factor (superfamily II helicase)
MQPVQEEFSYQELLSTTAASHGAVDISGLSGASGAYLAYRLYLTQRRPLVVVCSSPKQAEWFMEDLRYFSQHSELPLIYFPPYNLLPFKFLSYSNATASARITALYRMLETGPAPVVVTTIGAMMQKLIPKRELLAYADLLQQGEEIVLDDLIGKLGAGGYTRTQIVEEPGDFCLRGGILDIFSPLYDEPLRLELFGDMVESLRFFSPDTQRSLRPVTEAVILPAKEAILDPAGLDIVTSRVRMQASHLEMPITRVREMVSRIKQEGIFPGMESLTPLIYDSLDTLFDYVRQPALFIQVEPAALSAAAEDIEIQALRNYQESRNEKRFCLPPEALYLSCADVKAKLAGQRPLAFRQLTLLSPAGAEKTASRSLRVNVRDNSEVSQSILTLASSDQPLSPLVQWARRQKEAALSTLFVCRTHAQADRLGELLAPYGIEPRRIDGFPQMTRIQGLAWISIGYLSAGFVWPAESLALITEEEIFGTSFQRRKSSTRKAPSELLTFEDLKQGDLVVHNDHGIGRYEGLVKLTLDGSVNDFLLICYREEDKLYLPVDRMGLLQKYMGVDGVQPVLDKMGGKSWERVKEKVKQSTERIAGELLKIYAARKVKHGHAFGVADSYFRNFEAGFPYEETEDQKQAIEDVLADMRQSTCMDRLVCGDVGYGKTEVALRASFLSVSEAKQVALLVPTTVLAEQHYVNFAARFARYPVKLACLSRFRSVKEQRAIVAGLKDGTVDIVIGTHRLLQKDVGFKDLGLLVLDEEQRFGVKHKERLKRLKETVDVLALTATPIPRTLHLSLMGIRDISIISTPPEQRRAIRTYVSEYDDAIVAQAIRKELARGGQIFFVHNNIHSIDRLATHLQALVPEVRLSVAHGRMAEDDLERVMLLFMNHEIDMLVCTTIIESGLDIASANTILVNRADRFGLAQMYQLRGRVGRSDEQAYAYLFIPHENALSKDAQKRLKVLMEYSDLGSGFQIAMSDMKIRGGGTILGASQSGHIAAVGYDMFLKLMEESIAELKGEPVNEALEPEINLPMSAFLAEDYIADIDQRLSVYRRLARMDDLKQISDLKQELEDRFGPLTEEGGNLLLKIMLRVLAVRAGIKRLDLMGQQLNLHFSQAHQKSPLGIVRLVKAHPKQYRFTPEHVLKVALSATRQKGLLAEVKNILIEIIQSVNN